MDTVWRVGRWSRWRARGDEGAVSRLLATLDANLPPGWRRLSGAELPAETSPRPGSACYALDAADSLAKLRLSLERSCATELRGGATCFASHPVTPAEASDAWEEVMRFLEDGVMAAAKAAGAEIVDPTPEEVFLSGLFVDVRSRLLDFARAARKTLPLSREEAERWRALTIAAFRFGTPIDCEPLRDWLVADGWPGDSAAELSARFADHWMLLSQYAEETSAA
jgi:hypothetical protein